MIYLSSMRNVTPLYLIYFNLEEINEMSRRYILNFNIIYDKGSCSEYLLSIENRPCVDIIEDDVNRARSLHELHLEDGCHHKSSFNYPSNLKGNLSRLNLT